MGESIKAVLGGIVFLLVGLVATWGSWREMGKHDALQEHGVRSIGTVSGASSSSGRGGKSYRVDFTYRVNGKEYKGSSSLPDKVFSKYASEYFYSPSSIPIKYLPEDPSTAEVADVDLPSDHYAWSKWLLLMPIGITVMGGLYLYNGGASLLASMRTSSGSPPTKHFGGF
ncbi:DUF3592 domain-containing protein [Roseimicrobium gellanilyticum]|uniref:DUF3592 domain-containing protein n=1 Tax=Roseimicrobium gellanilyticum TaxID=748857 RepID=UPI0014730B99|nr:DUF3592 domain-containing protein [Roseimicrobium gellanilyticum]